MASSHVGVHMKLGYWENVGLNTLKNLIHNLIASRWSFILVDIN